MTEETNQKKQTLEGGAALNLWRQGREVWNSWINENPGCNISFDGVDFSRYRDSDGNLSFTGYCFGDGNVHFNGATFGDGNVIFAKVTFGDGHLIFAKVIFDSGDVIFTNATFGKGVIDFSEAAFSDCNVIFTNSNFGDGYVDFFKATFADSNMYFFGATFGDGEINFHQARIKELYFTPKTVGACSIQAEELSIKDRAIFNLPSSASNLKTFNLHSASFDGPFTLTGDLNIVPDLRATRYSHQVDLSDLKVKLPRISAKLGWPPKLSRVAKDPKNGARLRRLKEIAETNKDHQAALRFSADENRAKRWIETSWFGSVLDMAFSAFSDYGQNILRPFVALIVLTAASMGLYKTLATATFTNWWTGWAQGAVLSASNSLPFLPQSRDLREDALTALYGTDPGLSVDILMITQGVLSFVFLFLIGLGLRNRFRL